MSNIQAIIRKSCTTSTTFTGTPSTEFRQHMKAAGFKHECGNWFRTHSDIRLVAENEVAACVAA